MPAGPQPVLWLPANDFSRQFLFSSLLAPAAPPWLEKHCWSLLCSTCFPRSTPLPGQHEGITALAGLCFPYYYSWKGLPDESQLGDILGGLFNGWCVFFCSAVHPLFPIPLGALASRRGWRAARTPAWPLLLGVVPTGSPGTPWSTACYEALPVTPVPTL